MYIYIYALDFNQRDTSARLKIESWKFYFRFSQIRNMHRPVLKLQNFEGIAEMGKQSLNQEGHLHVG